MDPSRWLREHSGGEGYDGSCRVSFLIFLYPFPSRFLVGALERQRAEVYEGEEKTTRLKGGVRGDSRLQPPALNAAVKSSRHILDISVIVHTPPINLLLHLATSTSHATPTIISS
jgi:hypothetical protein